MLSHNLASNLLVKTSKKWKKWVLLLHPIHGLFRLECFCKWIVNFMDETQTEMGTTEQNGIYAIYPKTVF